MKYILAASAFALALISIALIVGLAMVIVLRPEGEVTGGVGPEMYNLPGTLFGLVAGVYAWRVVLRTSDRRAKPPRQAHETDLMRATPEIPKDER